MALGDNILDLVSGAGGHVVNRPALSAAVMQGQAMAGLRTAQTEDALLNAQKMREEQDAGDKIEGDYATAKRPDGSQLYTPSEARQMANQQKFTHGSFKEAMDAKRLQDANAEHATIADATAQPDARLAAAQSVDPNSNPYQVAGDQLIPRFSPNSQTAPPNVFQTPVSQSNIGKNDAEANLKNAEATNPTAFHPGATILSPGQVQTRAQMIANGQAPMPSPYEWSKNPKLASDTVTAALALNPNISQNFQSQIASTIKDFAGGGKNGQALTGYRTVDAHAALLKDSIEALQNGDVQGINNITNHAKLLFGDATPVDAKVLPQFIATEAMRALARNGIGGVTDRKELSDSLGIMNQGPEQQQETLAILARILNGGKKSLEASYNAGTMGQAGKPGTPTFDEVYAGKPFDTTAPPSGANDTGRQGAGSTPPASILKEGIATHFKNGQAWTLQNGVVTRVK